MPKLQSDKGGGMREPNLWQATCLVCVFCAVVAIGSPAQTFKTLVSFNGADGKFPNGILVQGRDGNYYGTTSFGGANCANYGVCGTVFKISSTGRLTTVYNFCAQTNCSDGAYPGAMILATNGSFYGTTSQGGVNNCNGYVGCGTVFKITSEAKLTTVYSFCAQSGCTDGYGPSGLIQATDGNLYGTTSAGGVSSPKCFGGCGTIFEITGEGKYITLHSFDFTDGSNPSSAMVEATNGKFYGLTSFGGSGRDCGTPSRCGTVFEITRTGGFRTLHSFCVQTGCPDGSLPYGLVQASNKNLYGAATEGGSNMCSFGCGTIFDITPGGTLTILHSFDGADGSLPNAVIQATDGRFYGTTASGGANSCGASGCGTVFEITPAGKLTTLYNLCSQPNCTDGESPIGLVQATNGNFYGTTDGGGDPNCNSPYGCGTVYSLSVGLGPFVKTNPTSGKVGKAVTVLGNNLTGSTSITFNGTPATFTVLSNTEIKTTVPTGATTGFVKVTTPTKTLKSNVVFRVSK
jgi:uncharacterized repeat protein (TIGR03803 family)